MFYRSTILAGQVALAAVALTAGHWPNMATAKTTDDGIVRVKSTYDVDETVQRLRADIEGKGIKFFMLVDQAQLGADAGLKLNPSKLLVFGNPPLGITFLTANPNAGLDWPVRLLVSPIRTSPGSPAGTTSRTGPRNSKWPRRSSARSRQASPHGSREALSIRGRS
jgi:hypothetical protein